MGLSFSRWFNRQSSETTSSSENSTSKNYVIYLVVTLSVLLTFGAWFYASTTVNRQARAQFDKELSDISKTIQNTIEEYVNASYGIKGLFATSDTVNRQEFSAYITELGLRERYPGLVAIYYAQKVAVKDAKAFTEATRKEGYPTFEIHPKTEADAFVINYIEPYNLYKTAHGFDAGSDYHLLKAMIQARDTGKPAITEKVTLQNAERTERAFIVFFPIYNNSLPVYTVKERQVAIKGYVGAVFNGTSFFQAVTGDTLGNDRISLSVYDDEAARESDLFYKNSLFTEESTMGKFSFKDTIVIPAIGNAWTLKFASLKNFNLPLFQQLFPSIVLVAGIIFTALLFMSLYILATGKMRALAIVDKMTSDLRVYADIVKNMTEGLLVFHLTEPNNESTFKLILVNPVSQKQLQKEDESSIVDKTVYDLFPHLKEKNITAKYLEVLRTKETLEYEDIRTTKDGPRTFLTRAFAMPNDSIGVMYVDITDQKNVQETLRSHSDELQKLNTFMVNRETKMIELKEEIKRLQAAATA
jgi:CHASE1-domain containing sensor protein